MHLFQKFEEPIKEMTRIGLIDPETEDYQIDPEQVNVMLEGRRTSFISLSKTTAGGFHLSDLEGKMSLDFDNDGNARFNIHTIKHRPDSPIYLYDKECETLINGKISHVVHDGNPENMRGKVIEYDKDLRDFIVYEANDIIAPDAINGFQLSPQQKVDFRFGRVIEFTDGTKVLHKETEPNGILSNTEWVLMLKKDGERSTYMKREFVAPIDPSLPQIGQTAAYRMEEKAMHQYGQALLDASREEWRRGPENQNHKKNGLKR
jgi:hypothetical protein